MKIYITGISGFLWINLVRYLLKCGYDQLAGIKLVDFSYPERGQIARDLDVTHRLFWKQLALKPAKKLF